MAVTLERLKVLVVDDNHHMINIVKAILRGFGVKDIYDAGTASDAFSRPSGRYRTSVVQSVLATDRNTPCMQ